MGDSAAGMSALALCDSGNELTGAYISYALQISWYQKPKLVASPHWYKMIPIDALIISEGMGEMAISVEGESQTG